MGGYVTTNLRLPEDLHKQLKHMAVEERKSVSQLVREALEKFVSGGQPARKKGKEDPFLKLIGSCHSGLGDGSVRHDDYLYGEK